MIDQTSVPDWVPSSVAQMAMAMEAMEMGGEIRLRLLTDPRMNSVWRVLQNEVKVDKAVFARIDQLQLLENWEIYDVGFSLNDRACAAFFACVLIETSIEKPPLTLKKVNEMVRWWSEGAKLCRIALVEPGRAGTDPALATSIAEAGKYFEDKARFIKDLHARNPTVLKRSSGKRGDDSERATVLALATGTHAIFGQYFYGTLATVTTVAMGLQKAIKMENVIDWCSTLPCP